MAALAMPTNSSAPPQTHRVSGQGRNVSDKGVKRAVSQRVWPPHRCGDSGTAAPEDSTTRAAKDGPVWFHCSAPAVRYEGKCGADSACANHSENEPSMKGLKTGFTVLMKLESNFFTNKGHVKAMDPILPTRAALIQIIPKELWSKVGIVGGRCSKFPLTCSLQRTRNGLHDPNNLKPLWSTSSRECKNKSKFNHAVLCYYGCKVAKLP